MTPRPPPERGMATLLLCVLLLFVLSLAAVWAGRHLTVAQRVAGNDLRAALAAEAAEAGLAWATAMLNTGRIDGQCRPAFQAPMPSGPSSAAGGAESLPDLRDFRARALRIDGDHFHRARPAGSPPAAACVNTGPQRWECRCDSAEPLPGDTDPSITATAPSFRPMFSIRFADAGPPGQLRLVARGCSDRGIACEDPGSDDHGLLGPMGWAEHSQHLALLSALRRPPQSSVESGAGAFQRVFGYPAGRYRQQPAVSRLRCAGDCSADLQLALSRGRRLLWVEGDLSLHEPLPASSIDAPLVLLVDGQLDIWAAMHLTGLLYARNGIAWHPPAGTLSTLHGAMVTDADWAVADSVNLQHDPEVLQRISRQMGSYLPVPGGWTPVQ
ncbi:hypothetical protein [Roseateles amylovorans]|uniref:Type 4 fimbrial biogenesis protein PilX N-terminal domain-containing protein n=1 Tax=Roseateles amylovorans TaxID=2978473 RepID=A0ABY6B558_9BURK|nr:hypothetical protein [Roseateles amylovorans]UXH80304.1 hypothetical protein N4261_10690 [Roseateles amylovorans]